VKYTYRDAGVDVERGETFAEYIKRAVKCPEWLYEEPTGYAAILNFTNPPIAVTADGIGTKLILHRKYGRWRDAAMDLVAMNYNDLVAVGAKPLAFLDYLGVERISEEHFEFISCLIEILEELGMNLVAGETAEMPGIYGGEWDAVGFCIGVLIQRPPVEDVNPGDVILGLKASGFHSNGWTLIRRILDEENLSLTSLSFDLLSGTRIYSETLKVLGDVKALAHVTGGGIVRALKRILKGLGAHLELKRRDYVDWVLRYVNFQEALSTFNMGYGMILVVDEEKANDVTRRIGAEILGHVKQGSIEIIY